MEKMWLKEVRYQFAYSIREQAFNGLKTFVKYQKVKRLYKDNRYVAFLNQCQHLVEQSRYRQAEATLYHQTRTSKLILHVLKAYAKKSKLSKERKFKADLFRRYKSMRWGMKKWHEFNEERLRIKNDKLLLQAHQGKGEFFSVGITLGSLMAYNNDQDKAPAFQDDNAQYDNSASEIKEDGSEVLDMREKVRMGKACSVKIEF